MGQSVLVFISHSSDDKESFIEPLVNDLENCYINVWIDKRKILPGDNLRKSIFKDGLDKADVALIFFTQNSLKSSWVDREIKHVLREEAKKGNDFDLKKIISIFDSQKTYEEIADRYPELTDDLLHLMPDNYSAIQLGQLISAIWSKYFSLQGGDVANQKALLNKDKEIFQKEKDILQLKQKIEELNNKKGNNSINEEFEKLLHSGKVTDFINQKDLILMENIIAKHEIKNLSEAIAFGLINYQSTDYVRLSDKGKDFFKWLLLDKKMT
jgi:hypothetical protein